MYTFDSRVRYSEIGEDKKLTLNSLLNYFQDCTTFSFRSCRQRDGNAGTDAESMGIGRVADLRRPVSRTGRKNYSLYLAL